MKENLYKASVSDWKLEFENGNIFDFVTLIKEVISFNSNKFTEIILMDCTVKTEVIELFKNKVKLVSLTNWFRLVNSASEIKEECEYGYLNPEIKNITIISEADGIAIVNFTFNCV